MCSNKITCDKSDDSNIQHTREVAPSHREVAVWEEKDAVIPTLKRPVMKKILAEVYAAENGIEGQECLVRNWEIQELSTEDGRRRAWSHCDES